MYECDMTHVWVRHDSCMSVTWLMYECDMTHLWVRHDSWWWWWYECEMTHVWVWRDSCMSVIWLIGRWGLTTMNVPGVSHYSCGNATWLIYECDFTISQEPRHSGCLGPRHSGCLGMKQGMMLHAECDKPRHSGCLGMKQGMMLNAECDMTHLWVWHDLFTRVIYTVPREWDSSCVQVTWLIDECDMT